MSLPPVSDISFHTWTSTGASKLSKAGLSLVKDEPKQQAVHQKPTRLERARGAISAMEKRLEENRKVRERLMDLEIKLDQVNKEMENAYVKINGQLTKIELTRQTPFQESEQSAAVPLTATHCPCRHICDNSDRPSWTGSCHCKRKCDDHCTERRLCEMERSLKRLDNIESTLERLSVHVGTLPSRLGNSRPSVGSSCSLYGCNEINDIFSQTQKDLETARNAISRMLTMPAVYSVPSNSEGIRNRGELETMRKLIDRFLVKLKNSKNAYETACGDKCIVCHMGTSTSISRCSPY